MIPTATSDANGISLAARFVTGPQLFAPDEARRRVADWLSDCSADHARALQAIVAQNAQTKVVIEGIAESSPYLFDLIRADPARAIRLLSGDPDLHLAELIARTARETADDADEAGLMRRLRHMKSEAALLIALCDIGGVWPVMKVTRALTDIAAASVQCAVHFLLAQEVARGRLLAPSPDRPEEGSGLIVFAMGKMGADELNYSSDIDLIVYYDRERAKLAEGVEPSPFFVRIAQGLSRLLQQRTEDGYVFRVDLRLRPDPSSTPPAISTAAALGYYEREGRTWERAAMIKARPCAGDPAAGEAMLADIAPFVWRKHLDFAALNDIHDMKRRMQSFRGQSEISVEGHNVKIGRGGIREIEFFAQTQQLIAGGRHPELRARQTLEALDALASSNWITFQARDELTAAYEFLRRVEHRLQMVADEQTHTLPEQSDAVERFARFFGYDNRAAFAADLLTHLNCVQSHYERLFEGDPTGTVRLPDADYAAGPDDARLLAYLARLGFKSPKTVAEALQRWLKGEYRALRVDTTHAAFQEFVPDLIRGLSRAESPDAAVIAFDRFLQALTRGGRLISLLAQNKDLVALVALILGAAPRLADMLAQHPQIMDGLVDPRFFGAMPDREELSARLAATLADANSYEEFLDRLRLFGQESLFLIGTRILSGTVSAQQASTAFANVAEGIVQTVHRLVSEQFESLHGRIKGQESAIVAMGKLGSREMTASSDLDLIFIYDFDHDNPDSDGQKPLHGGQYFARYTQRLISAFTTRTNYGVLYDIDMRLRPSGRAGPVATRIDSFGEYQDHEAWTWEHMALTRARVISSSPGFVRHIEYIIREVLTRRRDKAIIASDVLEMRHAIAEEKGDGNIWDLKYAAGGIVDIEFLAQYLQLVHAADHPEILSVNTIEVIDTAVRLGLLDSSEADTLRSAARLFYDLTQVLRLCVSGTFKPESAGEDLLRVMTRAADAPDFSSLQARLRESQADVRAIFLKRLEAQASSPRPR
ncbi:MAG: bifunctional [glutamine synthetase] adenylyltransferase/[glutamine synthetase]-adenylyl-L-tyrosine phosphorylase [Bradyrhizobiaceae bacterium]|nr:MAG: bifunctional [glutamine synthetase] adenylyltransferase/[glutamine synthetase]-adenylyl-L-tyrosine phosphorylase [Bradyrhizobiaceae bacterium]